MQLFWKTPNRTLIAIALAVLAGGVAYYGISQPGEKPSQPVVQPAIVQIGALGRLEPVTEVIKLSVPADLSNDRIAQLRVQRGDRIQANQVIAVLESYDRLEGAFQEAQEQIRLAQAELAQVAAGAKPGEIAAQRAEIVRLQAEIAGETRQQQATLVRLDSEAANARSEFDRYRSLYAEGAISASQFEQRRLTSETAQAQLNEGRANQSKTLETLQAQLAAASADLNRIAEVRPTDLQVAQTRVDQAIAAANRTSAELAQATIKAPIAGQVLEIYAKPGEVVGDRGIIALGQTQQMQVVAEVDQSDIAQVRKGQPATISGESFTGELQGTVSQVGLEVSQQETFANQPGENLDQRVVKVRIRLTPASSQRVAGLTNLQVQVAIAP